MILSSVGHTTEQPRVQGDHPRGEAPPKGVPRGWGGQRARCAAGVVHRPGFGLAPGGRLAQSGYMSHRRIWHLLLSLSLLLFPVFPHRTAFPAAAPTAVWRWPVDPPVQILRRFDPPEQRWLPGHLGVDLAAEPGQPVYPAGPGRVHFAGRVAGVGVVSVSHGDLRTTYLPVDASVARGDPVGEDPLGTLAAAPRHCPLRHCLHWGLLRDTTYLDPLGLVGHGEIRLLPLSTPIFSQQRDPSNVGEGHFITRIINPLTGISCSVD